MQLQHRIAVLGCSGMLGSTLYRHFATDTGHDVIGVSRTDVRRYLPVGKRAALRSDIDPSRIQECTRLLAEFCPTVIINCVGLIKQAPAAEDRLAALMVNSVLPHEYSKLAAKLNARLVHFSTDCVFSGDSGNYSEDAFADADDVYGRSKFLGEVIDSRHAITLRTSIIGHELSTSRSLLCWFLAQRGQVKGYRRAIFSGLPTVEIARVVENFVLPRPELHGLFHLAGEPIDKFSLLRLVRGVYEKQIDIIPDDSLRIDRSLDAGRFNRIVNYTPPNWQELVLAMRKFHEGD